MRSKTCSYRIFSKYENIQSRFFINTFHILMRSIRAFVLYLLSFFGTRFAFPENLNLYCFSAPALKVPKSLGKQKTISPQTELGCSHLRTYSFSEKQVETQITLKAT